MMVQQTVRTNRRIRINLSGEGSSPRPRPGLLLIDGWGW